MFGRPFPADSEQQDICRLYESGQRLQDVALKTGYCVSTVTRVLKRNGCVTRKRGTRKGTGPVFVLDDSIIGDFKTQWDKLHSTVKGTIAEAHVKTVLSERGFDVWEPFCQNHCTDLFVLQGRSIVRVQVKSATYDRKTKAFRANVTRHRRAGRMVGYTADDTDFFIIYCGGIGRPEFYVIPASLLLSRTDVKLYPHRERLNQLSRNGPTWESYRNAFSLLESSANA